MPLKVYLHTKEKCVGKVTIPLKNWSIKSCYTICSAHTCVYWSLQIQIYGKFHNFNDKSPLFEKSGKIVVGKVYTKLTRNCSLGTVQPTFQKLTLPLWFSKALDDGRKRIGTFFRTGKFK